MATATNNRVIFEKGDFHVELLGGVYYAMDSAGQVRNRYRTLNPAIKAVKKAAYYAGQEDAEEITFNV